MKEINRRRNYTDKHMKRYFEEGLIDRIKGILVDDNPYDDEKADYWEKGWNSFDSDQLSFRKM